MTDPIIWTPDTVTVGELIPWAENPRRSTKAEARRIIESREKFGEAKPLLIGPNNELYDGHQNTSALLAVKGKKHPVKVWRSNRELTTTERQELVLALHQGATGGWDLEALGNWDLGLLVENGFDTDALDQTRREMAFLIEMLGEGEDFNVLDEEDAFGKLPDEDRAPFQQMTFTLHDTQAEQVKAALGIAKNMGDFVDSENENSNGNALARICELFITEHGNG